jgi:hypothetical protein
MGGGDCLHRQATIFLNGGGDRGDELRSPHVFFWIQMRMSAVDSPAFTFLIMA